MTIVTNHMLRKKLGEVQQQSQAGLRGISTPTNTTTNSDELSGTLITTKKINRVQNEYLICTDGTKAKLLSPLPGMKWRCTGPVGSQGIIALEKELDGVFITQDDTTYCLGVTGDTNDFELIISTGGSEFRINDLFINMKSDLFVKNGLEEEVR